MFKLATTSYIWPADILFNVEKLKSYVDGVQLILFETQEESNLPNPLNIKKLLQLKEKYKLKYFIHLPLNINFSVSGEERKKNIKDTLKIISIGEKLKADYYIAHLNFYEKGKYEYHSKIPRGEVKRFYKFTAETLKELFKKKKIKDKFLIENINYKIKYLDYFIKNAGLNLCLDVGHIIMRGESLSLIKKYGSKIKLIHIHGLNEKGKDHYFLNDVKSVKKTVKYLKEINYKGSVVIEVFEKNNFFRSLDFLKENFKDEFKFKI